MEERYIPEPIMQIIPFMRKHREWKGTASELVSALEIESITSNVLAKVLAFAFGLSAEIERNLISQRTKEALARKRAEGVVLGRPKGKRSAKVKLSGKEEAIKVLLDDNISKSQIARLFKVNRGTLDTFIKTRMSTEVVVAVGS